MKRLFYVLLVTLLGLQTVIAAEIGTKENAATDAAIRELLVLTQSSKLVDGIKAQLDSTMKRSMEQALAGQKATPDQQKIIDGMQIKMQALFANGMKWEKFEPVFIDNYKKTFTQQEIKGMLDFYKSPAGHAVVNKMPELMQNTMQGMQANMSVILPKLQQLQQDTIAQLKAPKSK